MFEPQSLRSSGPVVVYRQPLQPLGFECLASESEAAPRQLRSWLTRRPCGGERARELFAGPQNATSGPRSAAVHDTPAGLR